MCTQGCEGEGVSLNTEGNPSLRVRVFRGTRMGFFKVMVRMFLSSLKFIIYVRIGLWFTYSFSPIFQCSVPFRCDHRQFIVT